MCHRNGGWVHDFKAYAPVTPHPELVNCRQCHSKQDEVPTFQATQFAAYEPPKVKGGVLPGSPPPIPHPLEMRSNCVACHAGPGAVVEIRTTHPERMNCRQCHALSSNEAPFEKAVQ
jgi:cytochrome c-type protein NapB